MNPFEKFGREFISSKAGLYPDILREMREKSLFGSGIPKAFGGKGKGMQGIFQAGYHLAKGSGNLGICLSWLIQELLSRHILLNCGNEEQKRTFLPSLAAGDTILCLAASEPGKGAHPKYLSTSARKSGGEYVLNGEKTYITNGPVGDLFTVIAVTGQEGNRKSFTAFLIPGETPGLFLTPPICLPFLKDCPHGGIRLEDCRVGKNAIIGSEGDAYEKITGSFRLIEDVMVFSIIMGGMSHLLDLSIPLIHDPDPIETGRLDTMTAAGKMLGETAAKKLETESEKNDVTRVSLFLRDLASDYRMRILSLLPENALCSTPKLKRLSEDLFQLGMIAGKVADLRREKIGTELMAL